MRNIIRFFLRIAFKCMKVHVKFEGHDDAFPRKGIYISNHVSFLDPIILFAFLPGNPFFALHGQLYRNKFVRFFMKTAEIIPVNFMDPGDVKDLITKINDNRLCVIFPEGRMTDNGALMKIYEAPCLLADRTNAPVIPVWIEGAQFGPFSKTHGKLPHRPLPKTFVQIGKPVMLTVDEKYRKERDYLRDQVYTLLRETAFGCKFNPNISLFGALMKAAKIYGKDGLFTHRLIIEDIGRNPWTYKDLIINSYRLGRYFKHRTGHLENVGVLLPTSLEATHVFFALSAYDRVPVMLNFSTGPAGIVSMCETAEVKTIITSHAFTEQVGLKPLLDQLSKNGLSVLYLEDVTYPFFSKLKAHFLYKFKYVPTQQTGFTKAVILFTSGSEGAPKGVVLTHAGLVANIIQTSLLEVSHLQDLMFASLPMFHSMGLTIGVLMPLFEGAKTFLFPSPLKHRIIAELLYELDATWILGTDTFFRSYAKIAHPYDFRNIRMCYAGAEAVKPDTRQLVMERLGVRLLEAYGATECSPVITGNNTIFNQFGTIGKLVPGMRCKLDPVEGIHHGGELCVQGPNVMLGYIFHDNPGVIVPPADGWYHTGDVVDIDEIGFVTIKGRIKRFAKIGGEMISLSVVENIAKDLYGEDFWCTAVALPHATKGEQIVLISNRKTLNADTYKKALQAKELSPLHQPSHFLYREDLLVLGTGKTDFLGFKKWAKEALEKDGEHV